MKVSNMTSRKGNKVPNQFIIETEQGRAFQSYDSIICAIFNNEVRLDEYYWNYSRTTSKYLSIFLNECTSDIKKKIKNGTYKLSNLN